MDASRRRGRASWLPRSESRAPRRCAHALLLTRGHSRARLFITSRPVGAHRRARTSVRANDPMGSVRYHEIVAVPLPPFTPGSCTTAVAPGAVNDDPPPPPPPPAVPGFPPPPPPPPK